jgi:glycosyltransferase involved in cell wall biosynthesis
MRVLYVHSGNLFGGVETVMLTLVQHQSLCPDMEPHFALCFEGKFSEELSANGASIHPLGNVRIRRPLTVRRARLNLKHLLQQKEFDLVVVHSTWAQAIFGSVVRSFGKPLVFWLHDVPDGMPWPERWARWSHAPEMVVCNSKYTADRLPKLYPQLEPKLIYCPVAPPAAAHLNSDSKEVRAEFQTPEDAVVILQISRLEPHKGHLIHLKALAQLRDLPGWVCWQVGGVQKPEERQYFETVQQAALRLGIKDRIRFLGWQSEVKKLIAASDIYCQPNLYPEPFGITFVEALYARKPVVATLSGGPQEIVDESCGFLVPPNDPISLAAALKELIENPGLRDKLGAAGPVRAQSLCDPATQMRHLREAFLTVAKNGLN